MFINGELEAVKQALDGLEISRAPALRPAAWRADL